MDAWVLWDKEVNNHWQKSIIASLQDNNTKMEEQIEKMKSGEKESKGPSKTSAAAPTFLYPSLASSATTPVLPPCPDHAEDLLDTWEPCNALPPSVAQPAVPVQNLSEADIPVITLVMPDALPYTHVVQGYK